MNDIYHDSVFGLIPDSPEMMARAPVSLSGRRLFHAARHQHVIPLHPQGTLPSCGGHAWSNYLEDQIISVHGKAVFGEHGQLDGDAIWRDVREADYRGRMGGGMTLDQGAAALRRMGMVPPETTLHNLPRDISMCCERLDVSPLVVGHYTWGDAWRYARSNGYIPPGPMSRDGHAVVLNGIQNQGGEPYPQILNSWSGWGWHGIGVMSLGMWQASVCSAPCYLDLGLDWEKWRGWERWIIPVTIGATK